MPAHHIDDTPRKRCRGKRIDGRIVGIEFEGDLRIAQRHTLELGADLRRRSRAFVEEAAARRHVVEKVAHEKLRPHRTHDRFLGHELSAVDLGAGAHFVALLARAQLDLRHGGDRRERLAAEAERRERIDVVHGRNLAGGMAVESHARVDGRHAAAVVDDLYQVFAAVAEVDLHTPGTGVDGVFHHLLHDRRRAVDHLAGRDLVGDDLGQKSDAVGHVIPNNRWEPPRCAAPATPRRLPATDRTRRRAPAPPSAVRRRQPQGPHSGCAGKHRPAGDRAYR